MTELNPLQKLRTLGQSPWLDFIQKSFLADGSLKRLIDEDDLRGLTSNPAIFEKAIASSEEYDAHIRALDLENPARTATQVFTELALADIRDAADLFAAVHADDNDDGMVSLEVSPALAHDLEGTLTEARALHAALNKPNAMIKVPGTEAGVKAFEELTAEGISVNVTLLFSVSRYQAIATAWIRGLERRLAAGQPVDKIASVASFFISRVDAAVDAELTKLGGLSVETLQAKTAVANAKLAYGHYQNLFGSEAWAKLAAAGAKPQRLLWASTSPKSPSLPAVYYVEALIGDNTVNTLPPATLKAYREDGAPQATLADDIGAAQEHVQAVAALGIDLASITAKLEKDGVDSFIASFDNLLKVIDDKRAKLKANA